MLQRLVSTRAELRSGPWSPAGFARPRIWRLHSKKHQYLRPVHKRHFFPPLGVAHVPVVITGIPPAAASIAGREDRFAKLESMNAAHSVEKLASNPLATDTRAQRAGAN
jgi:hypothetical protein